MKISARLLQAITDDRGELDPAPIMVIAGCGAILFIAGWDVIVNLQPFKPLETGGGCAALIGALWASKKGDAAVRQATPSQPQQVRENR